MGFFTQDNRGGVPLFGIAMLIIIVAILGVFFGLILQKSTEDAPYNPDSHSGQVRSFGDELYGLVLQFWPALVLLLVFLFAAAVWLMLRS
ncbi:hypothetical protein [Methanocella sp. MCL-LM]|uniref:hypothetical protein n=1 Tax=Methanocella sp. MCL-LM TaxID=3412035 RepID=UPI003C779B7D